MFYSLYAPYEITKMSWKIREKIFFDKLEDVDQMFLISLWDTRRSIKPCNKDKLVKILETLDPYRMNKNKI